MANRLAPGSALHDRALKHFEKVFSRLDDERKEQEPLWLECNQAFASYARNTRIETNEPRGDIVYMIFHFVETIAAFIVDNMLPEEDYGSMQGRGKEDKEPGETLTEVLQWRMDRARVREKLIKMVVRSLIYGVSWGKILWKREFRQVNMPEEAIDNETGEPYQKTTLQSFLAYSGPDLVPKGLWDVWYPRTMGDIDNGPIIDRDRLTLGDILANKEGLGWVNTSVFAKKVSQMDPDAAPVAEETDDLNKLHFDVTESRPGQPGIQATEMVTGKDQHDVYCYTGPFDYDGDGHYVPCVMELSREHRLVFRVEPQPMVHGQLPWCASVPMPWLEEFAGLSVSGLNMGKQNYINDTMKLIFDNLERALNQVILRDSEAKINSRELKFKAFKIYDVQTRPGLPITQMLHFLNAPDIKPSAFAIIQNLEAMAKVENSVEDFFATGQTRGVTKTSSGIAQITERAGSRHKLKITNVENGTIRRIGYQFFALDQQFATDEDLSPVLEGREFPRLSVEDIIRWWNFKPRGSETAAIKAADKENVAFLLQSIQAAAPAIQGGGFIIDWKLLMEALAKRLEIPELGDSIQIAPPPPVPGMEPGVEGLPPGGNGTRAPGELG